MGKRRSTTPTAMHETQGADLAITRVRVDSEAEEVVIANRGELDQPLTGWALASLHGLEVFRFPEGTVVQAGGEVRVVSGEGARARPPDELLWTQDSVWSNRSDTALLFDNLGHEVDRFAHPRPTIREKRVPKLKILVEDRDGYHLQDWDELVEPGKD